MTEEIEMKYRDNKSRRVHSEIYSSLNMLTLINSCCKIIYIKNSYICIILDNLYHQVNLPNTKKNMKLTQMEHKKIFK